MNVPTVRACEAIETLQVCGLTRVVRLCAWGLIVGLILWLRVFRLDSDAYPRLSWSSALFTDEGFYLHNARNVVLFGLARTDGFNNMLIMPLLHIMQVGAFRLYGVSLVVARGLSVACSLLTLGVFYLALRRAWGACVACWGLVLLGLDHANILYNRLALMDTPATMFLVAGSCAFVYAFPSGSAAWNPNGRGDPGDARRRAGWMFVCGAVLGAAYAVRGLAALTWPAPLAADIVGWKLDRRRQGTGQDARLHPGNHVASAYVSFSAPYLAGLGTALAIYGIFWWLPHRAELARINAYYVSEQLLPHSLWQLRRNISVAVVGWSRGMLPYLLRHVPIQLGLVACFFVSLRRRRSDNLAHDVCPLTSFLSFCLVSNLVFNGVVNYAPSRYYVLFYPALAGIAAKSLANLTLGAQHRRRIVFLVLAAWLAVNTAWMLDWGCHLTFRQRSVGLWLAKHLPRGSVLLGAVAPGLSVDTRFRSVSVIKDLCNDDHPVERYARNRCFILILDDRWKEVWWMQHYPDLVSTGHRMTAFRGVLRPFFTIGLYPVPDRLPLRNGAASEVGFKPDR